MQFLAGILVAWAAVYIVIALCTALAYFSFGRNRDYFALTLFYGFVAVFCLARAAHYAGSTAEQSVIPVRVLLGSIPMAGAALLQLGLNRAGLKDRNRLLLVAVSQVLAVVLAAICLSGLVADYSRPLVQNFPLRTGSAILYGHRFTLWIYVVLSISLGYAGAAATLLIRSARNDPVARTFFTLGIAVVTVMAVNDTLIFADLIRSIFLSEHGTFFLGLCVLIGFLRQFEISRRELQARSLALRQTSQRLDHASDETRRLRPMADLGRLSASLAHEIRNPLAVLGNVASTLRRYDSEEQAAEQFDAMVQMLQEETGRLARLVDDLLLFSETGRSTRGPVDPEALVAVAVSDVQRRIGNDRGIEVVTQIEGDIEPFQGNQESLRRALANLIDNAVQSLQSYRGEGTVQVIARKNPDPPDSVVISVIDNAGGVPEKSVADIFEPFYSTRSSGTGLGLSIARSIVQAHDGSLQLENRPGQGATFFMQLPLAPGPENKDSDRSGL